MPSVANSSTPWAARSRARSAIPSRSATESRARTSSLQSLSVYQRAAPWARARHGRPSIATAVATAVNSSCRARAASCYARAATQDRARNDSVRNGIFEYLFGPPGARAPEFTQQHFPTSSRRSGSPRWCCSSARSSSTTSAVRQLHRHEPLRSLQEWLLWTGLFTFGLILVGHALPLLLHLHRGLHRRRRGTFVWIRFFRFPPMIATYNEQLRRARFTSQARAKQAETTVRSRRTRGNRRRR